MADDEEEDLTVSTASHVNEENGCSEVDMTIKSECCPEVVEEDVKIDDPSMPDELRPLKKAKASINESRSCEVNNGLFFEIVSMAFNYTVVYRSIYVMLVFMFCNRFKCPGKRSRGRQETYKYRQSYCYRNRQKPKNTRSRKEAY